MLRRLVLLGCLVGCDAAVQPAEPEPTCDYAEFRARVIFSTGSPPIGQCFSDPDDPDIESPLVTRADGHVNCVVIEARSQFGPDCGSEGRQPVSSDHEDSLRAALDDPFADPTWTSFCEIVQLSDEDRTRCQTDADSAAPGFCYVSNDASPIGNPDLVVACAPPQRMLRFSGDALAAGATAFIFCDTSFIPCD